jgi:hypothetical protein
LEELGRVVGVNGFSRVVGVNGFSPIAGSSHLSIARVAGLIEDASHRLLLYVNILT